MEEGEEGCVGRGRRREAGVTEEREENQSCWGVCQNSPGQRKEKEKKRGGGGGGWGGADFCLRQGVF